MARVRRLRLRYPPLTPHSTFLTYTQDASRFGSGSLLILNQNQPSSVFMLGTQQTSCKMLQETQVLHEAACQESVGTLTLITTTKETASTSSHRMLVIQPHTSLAVSFRWM